MTNNLNISLVDDFLSKKEFNDLRQFMLFGELPWYYGEHKVNGEDWDHLENYQFTHPFFRMESHFGGLTYKQSPYFEKLIPILERMEFLAIYKVKANLEPLKPERFKSEFHWDYSKKVNKRADPDHTYFSNVSEKDQEMYLPCNTMTTSIFYLNTNDGYTEFEDGSTVNCVANRFITFPSNIKHRGVSQIDTRFKSVINFNYFVPQ